MKKLVNTILLLNRCFWAILTKNCLYLQIRKIVVKNQFLLLLANIKKLYIVT